MKRREAAAGPEAEDIGEDIVEEVSVVETVTSAPAAEIATHEEWARRKKMDERFLAPSGEFTIINPLFQDWAQARAFKGWVQGFELTEAEFDQAVADAKAPTFR